MTPTTSISHLIPDAYGIRVVVLSPESPEVVTALRKSYRRALISIFGKPEDEATYETKADNVAFFPREDFTGPADVIINFREFIPDPPWTPPPFLEFQARLSALVDHLKPGGLLCVYNTPYPVEMTEPRLFHSFNRMITPPVCAQFFPHGDLMLKPSQAFLFQLRPVEPVFDPRKPRPRRITRG